jgi:transposase
MDRRVKYSIKQKDVIVRAVLSGKVSISTKAKELGCPRSTIRRWLGQYKQSGTKGFKRRNGSYEGLFKLRVVRHYLKKELSLKQTASFFKIPNEAVICQWVKIYKRSGATGLLDKWRGGKKAIMTKKPSKRKDTQTDPAAQKLAEMQKELDYLRAENAFLKKLEALVQQEEAAKAQARWPKSSGN